MPRKLTPSTDNDQLDAEPMISQRVLQQHLQQTQQLLANIQAKVLSSAALNGGFDNLMFKIESMEQSQSNMSDKVDMIHDALYKPDDGFFARVKQVETSATVSHTHVETVHALDASVKDLKRWKGLVNRVTKWIVVAVGGGAVTLIGKLLYDFISGHIRVV